MDENRENKYRAFLTSFHLFHSYYIGYAFSLYTALPENEETAASSLLYSDISMTYNEISTYLIFTGDIIKSNANAVFAENVIVGFREIKKLTALM